MALARLALQPRMRQALGGSLSLNRRCVSTSTRPRPISPDVTIYSFPLNAIASISHRATGIALSVGTVGVSLYALGWGCDIPAVITSFKTSAPILVPFAKATVAFPFVYHFLGSLRHLYWDATALHMELEEVTKSSQILFGVTGVVTLVLAFYSC